MNSKYFIFLEVVITKIKPEIIINKLTKTCPSNIKDIKKLFVLNNFSLFNDKSLIPFKFNPINNTE